MAVMYHITPQGPRICQATVGSCRYGKNGTNHYPNIASAQEAFEQEMSQQYGKVGTFIASSTRRSAKQRMYRFMDKMEQKSPVFAAATAVYAARTYLPTNANVRRMRNKKRRAMFLARAKARAQLRAKRFVKLQAHRLITATKPTKRKAAIVLGTKYWMPSLA